MVPSLPLEVWEEVALFSDDPSSLSLLCSSTHQAVRKVVEVVHPSHTTRVLHPRPISIHVGKGFFQEQRVTLSFSDGGVVSFFFVCGLYSLDLHSVTLNCFGVQSHIPCSMNWRSSVDVVLPGLGSVVRFAKKNGRATKEEVVATLRNALRAIVV